MTQKVAIFGAGAQGRVTLDTLHACDHVEIVGFIDSNPDLEGQQINGVSVFRELNDVRDSAGEDVSIIVAIGQNPTRIRIAETMIKEGWTLSNAVHPSAVIAASAKIGANTAVMPHALVHSNARVEDHAIVNSGTVIEHDTIIGTGASISPGTQIGGRVQVGTCTFIGTGAIVLPRVRIGDYAVIGAGALVTKDVPTRTLVAGSPAKRIQDIDDDFDWKRLL